MSGGLPIVMINTNQTSALLWRDETMKRKKFFETHNEAKKFLNDYRKRDFYKNSNHWIIYDLKKTFPRRKKTRYFVGNYFEWLNI